MYPDQRSCSPAKGFPVRPSPCQARCDDLESLAKSQVWNRNATRTSDGIRLVPLHHHILRFKHLGPLKFIELPERDWHRGAASESFYLLDFATNSDAILRSL